MTGNGLMNWFLIMNKINFPYLIFTILYLAFLILIIVLADIKVATWVFTIAKIMPYGDKICHMILMGIFSYLLNSTLVCREIEFKNLKILSGSLIVYCLVLTEEISQIFVASRSPDIYDALADIIGIYLFGILAVINMKRKNLILAADT